MAGFLGMIGVILTVFPMHKHIRWLPIVVVIVIGLLGLRTATRGLDWRNQYTLADKSIVASPDDYIAYNTLSTEYLSQGNFNKAKEYAERSINIYPIFSNYNNLGTALAGLGDYSNAVNAYYTGLKFGNYNLLYENIAILTLVYGQPAVDKVFLLQSLTKFPDDSILWQYLAILEQRDNDNTTARIAINNAARYGQIPQFIYDGIISNQPFIITLSNDGKKIYIP
jgi:tetratricopeptide (TPR) repeat protein